MEPLSRPRRPRHPCQSAAESSLLFLLLTSSFVPGSCLAREAAKSFVPATDRAPLRRDDPTSPYALTLRVQLFSSSSSSLSAAGETTYNFLATQVWPSARVAARAIETYLPPGVETLCEFGCGPGLPSLAAAQWAAKAASCDKNQEGSSLRRVIATDIDPVALALVRQAALEQGLDPIVTAQPFDLVDTSDAKNPNTHIPRADLYVLADVFESSRVARGAARVTSKLLLGGRNRGPGPAVWVFAQTDRAQRDVYLDEMKRLLGDESLSWSPVESGPPALPPRSNDQLENRPSSRLWLCDVDETKVNY